MNNMKTNKKQIIYPNYFKYRTKDLENKFQNMITTKNMLSQKEKIATLIPNFKIFDMEQDDHFF